MEENTTEFGSQGLEPIPNHLITMFASHDCRGGGTREEFVDNLIRTGTEPGNKWYTGYVRGNAVVWVQQTFSEEQYISEYKICSANDCPNRDPTSWTLVGQSSSGSSVTLHTVNAGDVDFSSRWQWHSFKLADEMACIPVVRVRLNITSTRGVGEGIQLGHWHLMRDPNFGLVELK